jgi:hypothetical protein
MDFQWKTLRAPGLPGPGRRARGLEMALAARRLPIPSGVAGARLGEVCRATAFGREAGSKYIYIYIWTKVW